MNLFKRTTELFENKMTNNEVGYNLVMVGTGLLGITLPLVFGLTTITFIGSLVLPVAAGILVYYFDL